MAPADSAKSPWWRAPGTLKALRAAAAAVPVAMVNGTAFIGQFAFIRTHIALPGPFQVLFAATLEIVAIFLAWHAHIAQMRNDSASRLKGGAYSFALVMGGMNYSHWAVHWHPTVTAVGMALMSALSPWLWGIHSRRASRDALMAQGLVEPHAVRLGATRWTWHPFRSVRVMSWATWHGENEPARAIAHFEGRYGTADTPAPARGSLRAITDGPGLARVTVPVPPVVPPAPAPAPLAPAVPTVPAWPVPVAQGIVNGPLSPPAAPLPGGERQGGDTPDVIHGKATLEADANLSGGKPSQARIDQVVLALMATPDSELKDLSVRAVARMLGDDNQRRLGKRLLDDRKRAAVPLAEAPASESYHDAQPARRLAPGMIASPSAFQPGGNQ